MKKLKKGIVFALVLLMVFVFYLIVQSDDKDTLISGYESFYTEDKSTENLYKLCRELYGYTDYQKILQYYPKYLENDIAYNFFMQSEHNDFLAKQHTDSFKLDYCFALLHTSNIEQFEVCFYELKESVSNINFIYYYLAAEIETREYSDEQLRELLIVLKQLEKETQEDNKNSLLSNLSLQAYIHNLLKESKLYLETTNRIYSIENKTGTRDQSGDGSVIEP